MRKKTILLMLVLTCTLISSVGCGRRMNSATDGTDKNNTTTQDTIVEDNYDNTTTPNDYNEVNDNNNVVDDVMDGVDDTVHGITDGVEDVVDGVDNSVNDMTNDNVNTPSTGKNNTSR